MADLLINNKDAYAAWGVRMGDGFLDALGAPVPLKEFIENKSRLEHGKRVILNAPKQDERDLTLAFTLQGASSSDYQAKKKAFYAELYKGKVDIQVPAAGSEVYHLVYLGKGITYGQNKSRTFGKVSAKFNEPNPANRN
nr:MAG TPA: tail protein [Caudoviricetes sp.]